MIWVLKLWHQKRSTLSSHNIKNYEAYNRSAMELFSNKCLSSNIWLSLATSSRDISYYIFLSGTILCYLWLSCIISCYHILYHAIWWDLLLSCAISSSRGLSRAISGSIRVFRTISGDIWLSLDISGYL